MIIILTQNSAYCDKEENCLNKLKQENSLLIDQIDKGNQEKYKYQKEINKLDEILNAADRDIVLVEHSILDIEKQIIKNRKDLDIAILELKK